MKRANMKLTAAGPARAAAMNRQQGEASKPAVLAVARGWAAALAAKLGGLADAVAEVHAATVGERAHLDAARRAGGDVIGAALDRQALADLLALLDEGTATAKQLVRAEVAELPDLLGEARRVGELLAAE